MNIKEFVEKIKNGEINIVEHTEKVMEECKKINKEYNYFNIISEDLALSQAKEIQKQIKNNDKGIKNKKLLGVAVSVKDAICVKNVESTAGSRILKGYKPLFDATVVKKAKEMVHNAYEKDLRRKGRSGDIFALKNFGWTDQRNVDLSTGGKPIASLIASIEAMK